jgi:hypothetical protein
MNYRRSILVIPILVILLTSCNSGVTSKSSDCIEFECEELGWTFEYPASWKVLSPAEIAEIEGRGKTAVEGTVNEEITMNNKNILYLKKNPLNSFTSTMQAYDSLTDGPYEENQAMLTQLIIETYQKQGIQFDFKTGKTKIDGLEFSTLESTIYSPDRKKVIMQQIMYDRLFDRKYSLTMSVNYSNEADRKTLIALLQSSHFSVRE